MRACSIRYTLYGVQTNNRVRLYVVMCACYVCCNSASPGRPPPSRGGLGGVPDVPKLLVAKLPPRRCCERSITAVHRSSATFGPNSGGGHHRPGLCVCVYYVSVWLCVWWWWEGSRVVKLDNEPLMPPPPLFPDSRQALGYDRPSSRLLRTV